jgi:hypothetical protein
MALTRYEHYTHLVKFKDYFTYGFQLTLTYLPNPLTGSDRTQQMPCKTIRTLPNASSYLIPFRAKDQGNKIFFLGITYFSICLREKYLP